MPRPPNLIARDARILAAHSAGATIPQIAAADQIDARIVRIASRVSISKLLGRPLGYGAEEPCCTRGRLDRLAAPQDATMAEAARNSVKRTKAKIHCEPAAAGFTGSRT